MNVNRRVTEQHKQPRANWVAKSPKPLGRLFSNYLVKCQNDILTAASFEFKIDILVFYLFSLHMYLRLIYLNYAALAISHRPTGIV